MLSLSCKPNHKTSNSIDIYNPLLKNETDSLRYYYNYASPDAKMILSRSLKEISGLSYDKTAGRLIAINDEKGILYHIDKLTGKVHSSKKFGKKGDYEGLSMSSDTVIIVNSRGDLYLYNMQADKSHKIKTGLSATNDIEGITHGPYPYVLLAAKGRPLKNTISNNDKAIYRYDFINEVLDSTPYIHIQDEEMILYVENTYPEMSKSKLKSLKRRAKAFSPSGIAIHPDGSIYILSAKGSSLAIYKDRKLVHLVFLNSDIIAQPEGICFDSVKSLYIATEGKGFSGKIFRFDLKKYTPDSQIDMK